jgi:Big-like domain-containing protein
VTFTASVSAAAPGSGTPTGTVTFDDGSTTLGTGTLDSEGVATFSTSALTVGTHSIKAVYASDGNFSGSTSAALKQVVNKADSIPVQVSTGVVVDQVLGVLQDDNAASTVIHDQALDQVTTWIRKLRG